MMTTATQPSPSDLQITPRDRRFGRGAATPRLWHGGNVEATAIYNALSTTFPKGEAFFVESVRAFRDGVPEKLAQEIKAFTTQEAIHSREHDAFNRRALNSGYDLSTLEAKVDERLAEVAAKPKIASLAATTALEHFTAILAHELLADPRHLDGADAETARLWRWHAVEEIEHKGVAYDTWLHATRHMSRWKRWTLKTRVMLYITHHFVTDRIQGALELMRQDGVTGFTAKRRLLTYLWLSPGMFRKIGVAWFRYFLPGFHPWNEDDRALLASYDEATVQEPSTVRKVRFAV